MLHDFGNAIPVHRLALLLSAPMYDPMRGLHMSFLYMVGLVQQRLCARIQAGVACLLQTVSAVPLCPHSGCNAKFPPRHVAVQSSGFELYLDARDAYPLCGCRMSRCARRDALLITSGRLKAWQRWRWRMAKRRWLKCTMCDPYIPS